MKLSHWAEEWLTLALQLPHIDDVAIQEVMAARMDHLWYYFVSPTDKKLIERMNDQNELSIKGGLQAKSGQSPSEEGEGGGDNLSLWPHNGD